MILTCLLRMRQLSCYYSDISSTRRYVSRSGFSRGIISFLVVNFFLSKQENVFSILFVIFLFPTKSSQKE